MPASCEMKSLFSMEKTCGQRRAALRLRPERPADRTLKPRLGLMSMNTRRDRVTVVGLNRGRAAAEHGQQQNSAESGKKNRSHGVLSNDSSFHSRRCFAAGRVQRLLDHG